MNAAAARCSVPGSSCRLLQLELPDPRPVWAALDAAGARRFTGELTLHVEPVVRVWFVHGDAYLAERDGDDDLRHLLLGSGLVSETDLLAGVVRAGDTEHLGRLFDRVPGVDRDAVELAVELHTAAVLGEIADRTAAHVEIASYRQHPSGIQRWWQRPGTDSTVAAAAPSTISASVIDEVAALAARAAEQAASLPSMRARTTGQIPVEAAPVQQVEHPTPAADHVAPEEDVAPEDHIAVDTSPSPGAIELTRIILDVSADGAIDGPGPDEPTDISDDVRAAVRLALAEIQAATRPPVTQGLSVAALLATEPASAEAAESTWAEAVDDAWTHADLQVSLPR